MRSFAIVNLSYFLYPAGSIPFGDHVDFTALRITKSAGSLIDEHAQPLSGGQLISVSDRSWPAAAVQTSVSLYLGGIHIRWLAGMEAD
jgi:hypothetical protein